MIDKEVDGEQACDGRIAALLAVHLVSQVLDEASVIANTATETGHPWHYQSMLKNLENDKLCDADVEDTSFEASKGDSDIVNENKIEHVANVVATSTPEKVTEDVQKNKLEASYIGQGDEELELRQNETSMLINHLFDMSDVERVIICDETEIVQTNSEPNELITEAMKKIMESFVNAPLGITIETVQEPAQAEQSQSVAGAMSSEKSANSEQSEYSFLTDAYAEDIGRDIALYISDDGAGDTDRNCGVSHLVPSVKIRELPDEIPEKLVESMDVAKYENAYLTLNRDYDQNSEDEVDQILEDPKGMTLQEVELMTANTSDDNFSIHDELKTCKKLNKQVDPKVEEQPTSTLGVSTDPSSSKKSSLVSRCRSQGARLLACIRGWWRRRTPGRRKIFDSRDKYYYLSRLSKKPWPESLKNSPWEKEWLIMMGEENRIPFASRGLCPLSPDARRRAASLLDHRMLRSPPSTRAATWKFNTINEALVNSSHWKEYSFDVKAAECGEY